MPFKKTKKNKVYQSFKKLLSVYEYSKNFDVCEAIPNPEPLPGKDLLEPVAILKEKPAGKWRDKDILLIAKLIAGRISIDATGDNHIGANAFGSISKEFTDYVINHPKIRALIDPVYVFVDLPNVGKLAVPATVNYPPVTGGLNPLLLVNPSNHIYSFIGPSAGKDAHHFIGWLQGANPGVVAYLVRTPVPIMQY